MAAYCSGCVFTVCVHFEWVHRARHHKCRAQMPSTDHHTWLYVTSFSFFHFQEGLKWEVFVCVYIFSLSFTTVLTIFKPILFFLNAFPKKTSSMNQFMKGLTRYTLHSLQYSFSWFSGCAHKFPPTHTYTLLFNDIYIPLTCFYIKLIIMTIDYAYPKRKLLKCCHNVFISFRNNFSNLGQIQNVSKRGFSLLLGSIFFPIL